MGAKGLTEVKGFYRGKVLKHLKSGHCKIWIPGVYPDAWKNNIDLIPPAEQAGPLFCSSGEGNGMFSYPMIDTTVWCFFANNDPNYPIYFASALDGQDNAAKFGTVKAGSEAKEHLITFNNANILINNQDASIKLFIKNTAFNPDEKVTSSNPQEMCSFNMNDRGDIIINSNSQIKLNAPNITINGIKSASITAHTAKVLGMDELTLMSPQIIADIQFPGTSRFTIKNNKDEEYILGGL